LTGIEEWRGWTREAHL